MFVAFFVAVDVGFRQSGVVLYLFLKRPFAMLNPSAVIRLMSFSFGFEINVLYFKIFL